MTEEGDMRELLGRVLERQQVHSDLFETVLHKVDCLDRKVTQHRTGWQIFMWLGAAGTAVVVAIVSLLSSFVKS